MRNSLALSVAIFLAAAASPARSADCNAQASAPWRQSGQGVVAEARSLGARCDKAKIELTLRSARGKALMSFASTADAIMTFADVKTKAAMQAKLASWLAEAMRTMPTSAKLPDWKPNQTEPSDGEFPFVVDEGVTRPFYLSMRKAKLPMFCFVQGMESLGCAVMRPNGEATRLGAQTFPG